MFVSDRKHRVRMKTGGDSERGVILLHGRLRNTVYENLEMSEEYRTFTSLHSINDTTYSFEPKELRERISERERLQNNS